MKKFLFITLLIFSIFLLFACKETNLDTNTETDTETIQENNTSVEEAILYDWGETTDYTTLEDFSVTIRYFDDTTADATEFTLTDVQAGQLRNFIESLSFYYGTCDGETTHMLTFSDDFVCYFSSFCCCITFHYDDADGFQANLTDNELSEFLSLLHLE